MGKKKKIKLNKFNHNSQKNAQKPSTKTKKADRSTRIKIVHSTKSNKTNTDATILAQKTDLFDAITQKISLFALKPKTWLKSQTKKIDDALRPQLISKFKKIIEVVAEKLNTLKEIKQNSKQNEEKLQTEAKHLLIDRANNRNLQISYIQPVSQSSPKAQFSSPSANFLAVTKCNLESRHQLPKLMSIIVQPTARLEKIIHDLLQKCFDPIKMKPIKESPQASSTNPLAMTNSSYENSHYDALEIAQNSQKEKQVNRTFLYETELSYRDDGSFEMYEIDDEMSQKIKDFFDNRKNQELFSRKCDCYSINENESIIGLDKIENNDSDLKGSKELCNSPQKSPNKSVKFYSIFNTKKAFQKTQN
jgi:hypothetical protein